MIVEVWTIARENPQNLLVPSNETCTCEYCDHDHRQQVYKYFDVYNILGTITSIDIGKKVTYNTITECFEVENDEQFNNRMKTQS